MSIPMKITVIFFILTSHHDLFFTNLFLQIYYPLTYRQLTIDVQRKVQL